MEAIYFIRINKPYLSTYKYLDNNNHTKARILAKKDTVRYVKEKNHQSQEKFNTILLYNIVIFFFDNSKLVNDYPCISCEIKFDQKIEMNFETYENFSDDFEYIMNYEKEKKEKLKYGISENHSCDESDYVLDENAHFWSKIGNDKKNIRQVSKLKSSSQTLSESSSPLEKMFDFTFTTNESDIDIFLPHIDDLLSFLNIRHNLEEKIDVIIQKNLIQKKKGSKKLIDLEATVQEIQTLKMKDIDLVIRSFHYPSHLSQKNFYLWAQPIAKTLLNVAVESIFQKKKINYTPLEQQKKCAHYDK